MIEHTTDRLFWTLTAIIIGALILTIGVNAFPKMTQDVIQPVSGVIKQADHVGQIASDTGSQAEHNASNFDLNKLNTNSDEQAKANAIDADKLGFQLQDMGNGDAMITKYSNSSTTPTIPAYMKLEGATVKITEIGSGAFSAMKLTSVSLPDTITAIDDWAFQNNNLTNVTIPDSVKTIGTWAFQNNQLSSVTLSNSLISIGNLAFSMNQITTLSVPNSVTSIGDWAFQNNKISSLTFGNSINHLGDHSFEMNQLTSVTLPSSLKSLGSNVFNDSVNVIHNQ